MNWFKSKTPKSEPAPVVKPVLPMTRAEYEDIALPRVLIASGGIAGLTLAILLHRAGIAVCVLERAKILYPLGSMMAMGVAIVPLFKQLGMYEEFMERSKPAHSTTMLTEDLEDIHTMNCEFIRDYLGQQERIISRPELYTILRGNLPSHQIHLGKRVFSYIQTERGVDVRCSDNSLYHADMIVGAEGAHSAVRQVMYKDPEVAPTITAAENGSLPFKCVCLVEQTIPLDPGDFPHLDEPIAQSNSVLAETTMRTWVTVTTRQDTVCWMMIHFMDKDSVPGGREGVQLTLVDYLDKTPVRYLSKIVLEEIVFEKMMNPIGGVGAMNTMHDAVTLANWLTTLRCPDAKELETVFEEYRKERYPVAKAAYENSQFFRLNFGKSMMASLVRGFIKRMPRWLWKKIVLSKYLARPQASFPPLVKDDAKLKPIAQQSLIKTLLILKKIVDDPAVLCTDSPEVLAKAAELKEAEEKRAADAIEAGLVIHTTAPVDRSNAVLAPSPVAV
ncbi:hypothetical protein BG004_004383 [Podila humilis]|nr:hypothetical protein BG004_004383 [Podila humilis]